MLDAFFIVSALLCKFQSAITHYFQANQEYDFAKDVLYQDFPSSSPGKLKRWCGFHGKGGMLLVEFTIVAPELGITSTFISFSHTSKVLNQSNIYALSMEFSMLHAKLHVLPWGCLRMMESGASVSMKHAKSKLAPQSITYLQSYWHSIHQLAPGSHGWNSIGRCVMIFSGGEDTL